MRLLLLRIGMIRSQDSPVEEGALGYGRLVLYLSWLTVDKTMPVALV